VPATLTAATQAVARAAPAAKPAVTWTVRPGDTLSGIAAALGVRGGWQALYAANRQSIGPDPNVLRPGAVLGIPQAVAPGQPPAAAGSGGGHSPSAPASQPQRNPAPPKGPRVTPGGGTAPAGSVTPAGTKVGAGGSSSAGVMPPWLKVTLLAAALLTMLAFLAEPLLVLGRRRRRSGAAKAERVAAQTEEEDIRESVADKAARIIEASHERLIVTYSLHDHTIYLLSPPGEDPRMVLRAARLVVPEPAYQDLAGHLGIAPGWPEGGAPE
jgi:LysM repeat protein